MKEWFNSKELAGVGGLPNSPSNVTRKAKSLSWEFRQVEGAKGVSYEFSFNSLPEEVQAELLLKQSQAVEIPKAQKELNYLPEVIWKPYEKATDKQKEHAKAKLVPLHKLDDLVRNGLELMTALDAVAEECDIAKGSLKRWYYQVRSFERPDWLPLLIAKHNNKKSGKEAAFTEEAWEAFKADYFRNEQPQFGSCYERLKRAA